MLTFEGSENVGVLTLKHQKQDNSKIKPTASYAGVLKTEDDRWEVYITMQCGGSGMFIPDPGSWIPDPKTATKERGEKKFVVITFYVATNFTKLQIIVVLKC